MASRNFHDRQHPQCVQNVLLSIMLFNWQCHVTYACRRYMDEHRQDSVDIHPRRFEAGICARNFVEEGQPGGGQEEHELVDDVDDS